MRNWLGRLHVEQKRRDRDSIPATSLDTCLGMLERDADDRPTAKRIKRCLHTEDDVLFCSKCWYISSAKPWSGIYSIAKSQERSVSDSSPSSTHLRCASSNSRSIVVHRALVVYIVRPGDALLRTDEADDQSCSSAGPRDRLPDVPLLAALVLTDVLRGVGACECVSVPRSVQIRGRKQRCKQCKKIHSLASNFLV